MITKQQAEAWLAVHEKRSSDDFHEASVASEEWSTLQHQFYYALKTIIALRGTQDADDSRLLAATERVGMTPVGCDTADRLADEVLELRAQLDRSQAETDWLIRHTAVLRQETSETWVASLRNIIHFMPIEDLKEAGDATNTSTTP
jgi:hypothetical protein